MEARSPRSRRLQTGHGPKERGDHGNRAEEVARYFLAKDGSSLTKPELGVEVFERRGGPDQSISIEIRNRLCPPRLQGGGGDAGRISHVSEKPPTK